MEKALRYLSTVLLFVVLSPVFAFTSATAADSREAILVGRISHVEGKLLRYIEKEKDWVVTVQDSPFGLEDALYSEEDSRAEFTMPNRTWLRIGGNTQIQLIDLNPDATTVDVGSGLARLYNRRDNTVIKVTTPYGYVVATGDTVFDLYVGDESMEVIAIFGQVEFVHERTSRRYQIRSGSFSIIADHVETMKGGGAMDAAWDDWNGERDLVWNSRLRGLNHSAGHVPEPLREDAYVLDETGRWERVYYEGEYRYLWRPIRVKNGWRPFTEGRWVVYYGDHCWIPYEPFGYVTHHYGSWIYVETRRSWYWVPPVTRVTAGTPRFYLRYGWYPGRVSWIHRGAHVGWVPLAPWETYYCYRPWGYRSVVVNPAVSINVNLAGFFFVNHAVVVHRDHLFRGIRYTPHVERVGRDVIANNYQPVTIINNTVINNYHEDHRRFAVSDVEIFRKPHGSVVGRIVENQRLKSEFGSIGKERIMKDMARVSALAEPSSRKVSRQLSVSSKLVEPEKRHKPVDGITFDRKELKGRERLAVDSRIDRRSTEVEKGRKDPGLPKQGKKTGGESGLHQDAKHTGKEPKAPGRQAGEDKQIQKHEMDHGGVGKRAAGEQALKSPKKDRQETVQPEQKSSGGKGRKTEEAAVERVGGKKDKVQEIRQVKEPREAGGRNKEQGRQHEPVQQVEKKGPGKEQRVQSQPQDQPQRQKGSGKQKWQEETAMLEEQPGKKGGGKKND